ncbi:serine/threonine-protein kinase [Nocardioides sp. C4-1]|uniref:serine/threonine-protein kinase n=1 Tax=Nocardioides sp. C4-1 TaxID=3151851 RepID=UPI00326428F6
MPTAYPQPGDHIGRFRVLSQLGAGGMGVVYEALEVNLDRPVALKVIAPAYADDPAFRARFTSEARLQASLDSDHVVQVYAHGEDDGFLYIASQVIPDGDLGHLVAEQGPRPFGEALDLIDQVARGLSDAHAAGLVHRDIKPGNVLLRQAPGGRFQAYLCDFGIARRVDAELSRVAGAVGTPSYMAPELNLGQPASVATDVYALGCLLWMTLTGAPPYTGVTEIQVMAGHASRPVPQLPGDSPLVAEVNHVVRTAMSKDPQRRYRSADEVRDALQAALRMTDDPAYGETAGLPSPATPLAAESTVRKPTHAPPVGGTGVRRAQAPTDPAPAPGASPPTRGPGRRRAAIALAALVVVGIGAGTAFAVLGGDGGGDNPDPGGLTAEEQAFVDLDGDAITAAGLQAMSDLETVRIVQTFTSTTDHEVRYDVRTNVAGGCLGELSIDTGAQADLLVLPETETEIASVYVRPNQEWLVGAGSYTDASAAGLIEAAEGRWIQQGVDGDDLVEACDLAGQLDRRLASTAATNEKGAVGETDGRPSITLRNRGAGRDATLTVAADDPHHVLRIESSAADYAFSEFDAELEVDTPPATELMTFEQQSAYFDSLG